METVEDYMDDGEEEGSECRSESEEVEGGVSYSKTCTYHYLPMRCPIHKQANPSIHFLARAQCILVPGFTQLFNVCTRK